MNIADMDLLFFTIVFGGTVVAVMINQIIRYVQITKYEKRIKKQINWQGYTINVFDYDIMNTFFDKNLGSLEAANEMIAVFMSNYIPPKSSGEL